MLTASASQWSDSQPKDGLQAHSPRRRRPLAPRRRRGSPSCSTCLWRGSRLCRLARAGKARQRRRQRAFPALPPLPTAAAQRFPRSSRSRPVAIYPPVSLYPRLVPGDSSGGQGDEGGVMAARASKITEAIPMLARRKRRRNHDGIISLPPPPTRALQRFTRESGAILLLLLPSLFLLLLSLLH